MKNKISYPLVSIIVPVYNVEKYVSECLESLIKQTYKNIEIIVVNDGSTDNCAMICEDFSVRDNRIKVINKRNGGLSDARNMGINKAKGKYVMFVDSDDYVNKEFAESAMKGILKKNADIACFRFLSVFEDGSTKISSKSTPLSFIEYSNVEAINDIFTRGGSLKVNAWNKIYKKELFLNNEISYPVGRVYEDNLTTYKLMYYSKKVIFFDKSLLFYRQRAGSIMKNKLSVKGISRRLNMVNETREWLKNKISKQELSKICRNYKRTLIEVLVGESIRKRQVYYIPVILILSMVKIYE